MWSFKASPKLRPPLAPLLQIRSSLSITVKCLKSGPTSSASSLLFMLFKEKPRKFHLVRSPPCTTHSSQKNRKLDSSLLLTLFELEFTRIRRTSARLKRWGCLLTSTRKRASTQWLTHSEEKLNHKLPPQNPINYRRKREG